MLRETHESGSVWTDALCDELRRLHADGYSASQIANALGRGLTRNAVIGKIGRLNLRGGSVKAARAKSGKNGRAGNPGMPKVTNIVRRAESRRIAAERQEQKASIEADAPALPRAAAWLPLYGLEPVSLIDLGAHDCKWPLGDPLLPGFGYCGLPQAGEHSRYCEAHHAMSVIRRVAA